MESILWEEFSLGMANIAGREGRSLKIGRGKVIHKRCVRLEAA